MGRSSRRSESPLRALLSIVFVVVGAFVIMHVAGPLGNLAGKHFADSVARNQGIPTAEEKAAARVEAADSKFVPAMHRKLPRLVHAVADAQVARIATHACEVLDNYAYTSHYQDTLRRDTRRALTHGKVKPTVRQVNTVIRTAGHTTCPEKDFLARQFQ